MNDKQVYLVVRGDEWQLGSADSETAERIQRILDYLDLNSQAEIHRVYHGIAGVGPNSVVEVLQCKQQVDWKAVAK